MKPVAVAVALSALIAPVANATTPPPKARVSIEEVGHGGPSCGITEETAKSAVRAAMRYNRIIEAAGPQDTARDTIPTIYFSGNVANVNGQCTGNYTIQFYSYAAMPVPWSVNERMLGKTLYCEKGGMTGGLTSTFSTDYLDGVKRAVDNCLSQMTSRAIPVVR